MVSELDDLEEARAELRAVDAAEAAESAPVEEKPSEEKALQLPEATRRDLIGITQQIAAGQKELAVLNDKAGAILRTLMQVSGVSGKVTGLNLETGIVTIGPLDAPAAEQPVVKQGPVLLPPNRAQRRKAGNSGGKNKN